MLKNTTPKTTFQPFPPHQSAYLSTILNYINLNGKIIAATDATIPVDNGAFRYGYGLFETMLVQDGTIRLAQYHWQRLIAGAQQLYFELPPLMTPQFLESEVLKTVRKNKLEKLCRVRLQLFAAGGGMYGLQNAHPGFIVECFPLAEEVLQLNENGLVLGIATGLAKSPDLLSNLKSCNALIYAVAARQAKTNKWNDALVYNTLANIIESALANIFWIKDGVIYTPPLTEGCVAGVMRRHILDTTSVVEQPLSTYTLLTADEVFLTNAIKNIRWVSNLADSHYDNARIKSIYSTLTQSWL